MPIDRRVEVLKGLECKEVIFRVSELRSMPFVVFLGEPGIGKSTVLENEAKYEGALVLKVRSIITRS